MKNYLVQVLINFDDTQEQDENGKNKKRVPDDTFYCTKERYEFLKEHNAVMLLEIKKEEKPKKEIKKKSKK